MPTRVVHNPVVAKSLDTLRDCLAQLKSAALADRDREMAPHLVADSADMISRDLAALASLARGIKGLAENAMRCRYSELWLDRPEPEPETLDSVQVRHNGNGKAHSGNGKAHGWDSV